MKKYMMILIGVACLFFMNPELSLCQSDDEPFIAAVVDSCKGDVTVKRQSGDWEKARTGMILGAKHTIKTGLSSEVAIEIIKSNRTPFSIIVNENTQSLIADLVVDKLNTAHVDLDLHKGKLTVPVKDFDSDTELVTQTPNAVVEMSKTGFVVKYPKK